MSKRGWQDADVRTAASAARNVLSDLQIRHPTETELENIAFMRGATVRTIPLMGAEGRLTRVAGGRAFISVASRIAYSPRRRWVIAHELGHFETHDDENQLEICDEQDIDQRYDPGTEREANAFAAELLMPSSLWEKRVDVKEPTLVAVSELADEFQVSLIAAAIRFVKLSPERCALVFAKQERVQWAAYSSDFGFWIDPHHPLDPYTVAMDYFKKGFVTSEREIVSARSWVTAPSLTDDDDLVEYCRPVPSLEATLSLLWIPPDADY